MDLPRSPRASAGKPLRRYWSTARRHDATAALLSCQATFIRLGDERTVGGRNRSCPIRLGEAPAFQFVGDSDRGQRGSSFARRPVVPSEKCFVYILQSERVTTRYYSGLTSNVDDRIAAHNRGLSPHTTSGSPWKLVVAVEFANQERAIEFERYLKSGSGRAFAKRHFR